MSSGTFNYYEVTVLWISIPNVTLNTGYGGTIGNYPYIYIRLYNDGAINTVQNLLSNNNNSILACFRINIDSYILDRPTNFWTIKGDDTHSQIIKLRVDQSLRYTLTLPDGSILLDETMDSVSPSPPNPLLQTNACFSIKPVKNFEQGNVSVI